MTLNRRFLQLPVAILLMALAIACSDSGGSSGGKDISESEATQGAKSYFLTVFGVLSGAKPPQNMIDAYAPECREGVKASDINAVLGFVRLFAPGIANAKIQDVDLGKLKLEPQTDGVLVKPTDGTALRVKIDGKFTSADDYFSTLGLSSDDDVGGLDAILLVKRDGKVYVGDCEELRGFSDPFGSGTPSASGTPRPGASPTLSPNRPGGSRTNPAPFGQATRVDGTWEITVLSVNKDASSVVLAASRFNATPTTGERLVLIKLRAKNIATDQKVANIDDFNFRLTGSKNTLYSSFNERNSCGTIPTEIDADLFPGGTTEGNVCFKVPSDETGLLLVWQTFSIDLTFLKLD